MLTQRLFVWPKSPLLIAIIALATLAFIVLYQLSAQIVEQSAALSAADYVAYAVCHRLPTHSFAVFGRPLPLCARCGGIYLGIVLSFSITLLTQRHRHARFSPRTISLTLLIFGLLMVFDGFNSLLYDIGRPALYTPNNILRLITGFGAGLAVANIVSTTFAQSAWRHIIWQPQIASFRELALQVALATTLILLILSNQPTILFVLAIISAVGVLLVLSLLYTTLILMALRKDGTITRYRQLILPITGGMMLTMIQIVSIASFRFNLTGTWSGF